MENKSVLLAQKYDDTVDPTGWWMSEKLDGVRAYWNGSGFYSRLGNKFVAPKWFTEDLPKEHLDGELWCGRGLFHKTMSIVKKKITSKATEDDWKYVTYLVFDAPGVKEPYEKRVKWLQKNIDERKSTTYAAVVGVSKCKDRAHLKKVLKKLLIKGGEGVMLRKPGSMYERCRSSTLLKVKYFHDEEAKVESHLPGTGRCASMMGKLCCVLPNGTKFKVGTGFSDAQRKKPPKAGSIITFKYQELSQHGHPRFPVFVRERPDLTWSDVLKAAKERTPFSQIKKPEASLKKQHSILFSIIPSRDRSGKKVITTDDEQGSSEDEEESRSKKDKERSSSSDHKSKRCDDSDHDHDHDHDHDDERERDRDREKDKDKKRDKEKERDRDRDRDREREKDRDSGDEERDGSRKSRSDRDKDKDKGSEGKPKCRYGALCYRSNPKHLKMYAHPPRSNDEKDKGAKSDEDEDGHKIKRRKEERRDRDRDEKDKKRDKEKDKDRGDREKDKEREREKEKEKEKDSKDKPPCKFGSKCYRTSTHHLAEFSHDHREKGADSDSDSEAEEKAKEEKEKLEGEAEESDDVGGQWGLISGDDSDDEGRSNKKDKEKEKNKDKDKDKDQDKQEKEAKRTTSAAAVVVRTASSAGTTTTSVAVDGEETVTIKKAEWEKVQHWLAKLEEERGKEGKQ